MSAPPAAGVEPRFRATDLFPPVELDVQRRDDGVVLLRSLTPRPEVEATLAAALRERAHSIGDRTMLAARDASGEWQHITYAQAYETSARIAGWLRSRGGTDRIMIVTGNSPAHALLCFGAAIAGVPVCPVSAQYALGAQARLAHVAGVVRPTLVFAERAVPIADALATTMPADAQVICTDGLENALPWQDILDHPPLVDLDNWIDALDPDAPLRYMLTSGSTGLPKAVVQTNRMWCSLFAGANGVLAKASGWGERTLDWMPWSHVAGLSVLIGSVLNGGAYYLDEGRPLPELFPATLRNLAEVQPLFFANVPYAFGMLCDALEADDALRERFFEHLQLCLYGGAGLPQPIYDRFQAMAERTIGERVMFTTGYGCTEATSGVMSITWPTTQVGVGLPLPGLEVKLVPLGDDGDDRLEVRFRGDCVMPGYLDDPSATAAAFDDEGFYRTGDAVTWIDGDRPELGLAFAGRLAEEFKLTTGTFVRGGAVRAQLVAATSPVVSDAVLCGEGHAEVGALLWLNPAGCAATLGGSWTHDDARDWIASRLADVGDGSADHVNRFALLSTPPDVAAGEMSDKGTVNQALARRNRAGDVANLYAGGPEVRFVSDACGANHKYAGLRSAAAKRGRA